MICKTQAAGFLITAMLVIPGLAMSADYGLKVGDKAPPIHQKDITGRTFDLVKAEAAGPVVLVFYRGGWCPFCNQQLHDLQVTAVPFAKKHHAQLVAISVDKATEEAKTQAKHDLTMTILSDTKAALLGAYNVQNHISPEDYEMYKTQYHLDLEKSSGQKHHIIAVPAVFVIDSLDTIVYAHADFDYKKRAPISDIEDAIVKAEK